MANGQEMNGHNAHETSASSTDATATIDLDLSDGDVLASLVDDIESADQVYSARFEALNNSGVTADALLLRDGNQLKVVIAAEGLEAGLHPAHIHGMPDGADSTIPTLEQDADLDGFVEVLEGAATYGPIILNLTTDPDAALDVELGALRGDLAFPAAGEDGRLVYAQTFDFDSDGEFAGAIFDELMPLENRHLVLHGASVMDEHGAGTEGEVDGTAGYKAVLPVANAEIVEVTSALGKGLALAGLVSADDLQAAHADLSFGMA